MSTHPGLGQWAPIHPSTDRASWTEYQRLLTAGGNPATATVLAAGRPRPDDDRANWRQLARGTRHADHSGDPCRPCSGPTPPPRSSTTPDGYATTIAGVPQLRWSHAGMRKPDMRLLVEGRVQDSSSCRTPSPYREERPSRPCRRPAPRPHFRGPPGGSMRSSHTAPTAQEHTAATAAAARPRAAVHPRRRASRPG